MALTADLRRGIDAIRDYLLGGGFPDPMANAEQLSYPLAGLTGRKAVIPSLRPCLSGLYERLSST